MIQVTQVTSLVAVTKQIVTIVVSRSSWSVFFTIVVSRRGQSSFVVSHSS